MKDGKTLMQHNSGYISGVNDWVDFLKCWRDGVHRTQSDRDERVNSILFSHTYSKMPIDSEDEIIVDIKNLEDRLGEALPKSYKDFLLAYWSLREPTKTFQRGVPGFLQASQVGRLVDIQPEIIEIYKNHPLNSTDERYFSYGINQDDATGRTQYLRKAILIGFRGDAIFEVILLYPDVKTNDNEMEASILLHAGEFRAPSFAELMRQLSVLEVRNIDGEGIPYSQKVLSGTCADKLHISNIWWE